MQKKKKKKNCLLALRIDMMPGRRASNRRCWMDDSHLDG